MIKIINKFSKSFVFRHSPFFPRLSSFLLRPSSFVYRPSLFLFRPSSFVLLLSFLIILLSSFVPLPSSFVNAAVPHLLNYQGRLTDTAGSPLNGTYTITFRIYNAETAGSLLWEESQSVVINKGVFSVLLGSVTALNIAFDVPYFLEIKVGGEVMSPRQRISSAAYAFTAENTTALPRGIITMWSGTVASIPQGWALCDGTSGTPDLRGQFIVGAGSSYSVGNTGGAVTHAHGAGSYTGPNHTHNIPATSPIWGNQGGNYNALGVATPNMTPSSSIDNPTGSGGTGVISGTSASVSLLPPYYALAFIMKL